MVAIVQLSELAQSTTVPKPSCTTYFLIDSIFSLLSTILQHTPNNTKLLISFKLLPGMFLLVLILPSTLSITLEDIKKETKLE